MLTAIQVKRNKAFIAALRSGKYKQVTRALRLKVGGRYRFCCLGVACEVKRLNIGGRWNGDEFDGDGATPPEHVYRDYYGWDDADPYLFLHGRGGQATHWNDKERASFAEIADAFEAWLKKNTPKRKPATKKVARKKTSK